MSTKLNISIAVDSREEAELATKAIGEAVMYFRGKVKNEPSNSLGSDIVTNVSIVVAPPMLTLETTAAEPRFTEEIKAMFERLLFEHEKYKLENLKALFNKTEEEKPKSAGVEFTATDPKVIISNTKES